MTLGGMRAKDSLHETEVTNARFAKLGSRADVPVSRAQTLLKETGSGVWRTILRARGTTPAQTTFLVVDRQGHLRPAPATLDLAV